MKTYTEYPKYCKALEQLSKIDVKIGTLEAEANEQQANRQGIIDRLQEAEAALILDRVEPGTVEALRKELASLDTPDTRALEAQRKAASILRAELPALKAEAIQAFCNEKKPPYCQALKKLSKALVDAKAAYIEVDRLFTDAAQISPTHTMQIATGGTNPDIPTACGLPQFNVDIFTVPGKTIWNDDTRKMPADRLIEDITEYTNS